MEGYLRNWNADCLQERGLVVTEQEEEEDITEYF